MSVRAGDQLRSCCSRLHAEKESEATALRLRIAVLEAALDHERESSTALAAMLFLKNDHS